MKWEYLTAYHYYQEQDKAHQHADHLFLFKDSGELSLDDGLAILGRQGWELVGIQPQFQVPLEGDVIEQAMNRRFGKPATSVFFAIYVFKRPAPE